MTAFPYGLVRGLAGLVAAMSMLQGCAAEAVAPSPQPAPPETVSMPIPATVHETSTARKKMVRASVRPTAPPTPLPAPAPAGEWAVDVGSGSHDGEARRMAERAASAMLTITPGAKGEVDRDGPSGSGIQRARVIGMSKDDAATVCHALVMRGEGCSVVFRPTR